MFDSMALEKPGIELPSQVDLEKWQINLGMVWIPYVLHSFQLIAFSPRIQHSKRNRRAVSVCFLLCSKLMLRTFWAQRDRLGLLWHVSIKTSLSCDAPGMPTGRDKLLHKGPSFFLWISQTPRPPSVSFVVGRGSVFWLLTQDVKRDQSASEALQIFLRVCLGAKLLAGARSAPFWGGQMAPGLRRSAVLSCGGGVLNSPFSC